MTTAARAPGRDPDWDRAERFVAERLGSPDEKRIVAYEAVVVPGHPTDPPGKRVGVATLAPGASLVVFFDAGRRQLGWRDDGRLGVAAKPEVDPRVVTQVRDELGLPGFAPSEVRTAFLDPIGWTVEVRGRFVDGGRRRSLRAWASPETGWVIQVVHATGLAGREEEPLPFRARLVALELLRGRLRRAGIRPDRPHQYFLLEAGREEPFEGGTQVSVRTWRQWSDGWVEFPGPDQPPSGWRIDRLAEPLGSRPEPAAVIRIAAQLAPPPEGATRPVATPVGSEQPVRAWRVSWEHAAHGLPVVGDWYRVDVDPDRRRLVGLRSRWRDPGPIDPTAALDGPAAADIAVAALHDRGFDDSLVPGRPSLVLCRPTEPPEPGDRLAWRVPFADQAGTVDAFVDARSGALIALRSAR